MDDSKITLLLGAGASIPFLCRDDVHLTTDYLTRALLDKHNWDAIIQGHNQYKKDPNVLDKLDAQDCSFVILRIKQYLEQNSRFQGVNFEYIIHLLDKIANYLSANGLYECSNIDEIMINFFGRSDTELLGYAFRNTDKGGWRYAPFLAREIICKAIIELWDRKRLQSGTNDNKTFFSNLLAKFPSVNIYSLNYDPLIYEAIKNLDAITTGFCQGGEFSPEAFYSARSVVAFVHGHVGFIPLGNKMRLSDDYARAQKKRMQGVFDNSVSSTRYFDIGAKGLHYNTYLVTGLDKIDSFTENPFASYLHRFGKDIIESDFIIMVGLSLGDHHLNAFMTNATLISDKKLLFVTKTDVATVKNYFHVLSPNGNIIFRLWTLFRDSITVTPRQGGNPFQDHLESLYDSLASKGYGKLTNHIMLYIKGTEEFYKEDIRSLLSSL